MNIFRKIRDIQQENLSAIKDGRRARLENRPVESNPHKTGSRAYSWWRGGWDAVNRRMEGGVCDG